MKFSFLGRGPESPPLQLYGKLPVAKDYLRIGCGDGSTRDVRDWLDRTFGTVRDDQAPLILAEPLRFLGLGSKEPLQGCLWPSADAGEHRKFPFMVVVERKHKALLADLEEGNLSEAEGTWRLVAEKRELCMQAADGQALLSEHRGTDIAVTDAEDVPAAPADFDTWVECLWPDEGLDGLFELVGRATALARDGHTGPYRLPLVRVLPLRDQIVAWVALLWNIGALPKNEVPTLFFPPRSLVPSSAPASLVISARPFRDDEVSWLTARSDDAADLGPADLAYGIEGDDVTDGSPPEGDRWLREALLEVLESRGEQVERNA